MNEMYYLFIKSGYTPIIVYTSGDEKNAREIHKQMAKNVDYVSEELRIFAFSSCLEGLEWLIGDKSAPLFYNGNDVPPKVSKTD
ncbi:MAG: hypothetical protein SO286_00860 [Candidatus Enterosoma sp.]|nr:hypothetical protein [Candidatus Enterosoma sp.]